MIGTIYAGEDPERIAAAHIQWALRNGISRREILQSIGVAWPYLADPDHHDIVRAVAEVWVRLQRVPRLHIRERAHAEV